MEAAPEEEDNNPFAEDADETPSPSQEDSPRQMNGKEGVPVRALYDYTVTEEDELPLKAGEFLHKGDLLLGLMCSKYIDYCHWFLWDVKHSFF